MTGLSRLDREGDGLPRPGRGVRAIVHRRHFFSFLVVDCSC